MNVRNFLWPVCKSSTLLIAIAICAAWATQSNTILAEDWAQYRGLNGAGVSEKSAPTVWNAQKNVLWKTALPGRGASSPIVVDDKIFLTAYTGYGLKVDQGKVEDLELHTICLSRKTGQELWRKSIKGSSNTQPAKKRVVDHGFATGTCVSDGTIVVSHFGVSGLVAYDLNGKKLWQAEVGDNTTGFGSASSPVMHENLVIINASIESKSVIAFEKSSGKKVWEINDFMRSWSVPCLAKSKDGNVELILNQKNSIHGFDPATGKELWNCEGIMDYIVPQPISNEGVVYCLGGRSNRFIAIRLGGRGDVTKTHKIWELKVGANVTSPVFYKGYLYWASDKGIANCVNAKDGSVMFRKRMPTTQRVYASIVRAGDNLYLTMRDQGVLVLKANPEYQEVAQNRLDSEEVLINATPAITDGKIYLRSDSTLYCIGE